MKEMTSEEFEKLIQEMIDGKKKIKDGTAELETDYRTFHRRVMELSTQNPELYRQYVIRFPYKPKQLTHIDYEALLIHAMKQDLTLAQATEGLEISDRTIRRNIKTADISSEIVELYRIYANAKRGPSPLSEEVEMRIDELIERPIVIDDVDGKRKRTLTGVKDKLYEDDGRSFAEKSKEIGMTYRDSRHKLQELRRIVKEREAREREEEER